MPGCERQASALPVLTTCRSLRSGSRTPPFSLRPEPILSQPAPLALLILSLSNPKRDICLITG